MPSARPPRFGKRGPQMLQVIKTEEKGSDVALGALLVHHGHQRRYEAAIVISNDSDLVLPIKIVTEELHLPVGILNPHKNFAVELTKVASFKKLLPFGDTESVMIATTDDTHPRYGAGLNLVLLLPNLASGREAAETAFSLNTLELTNFTRSHFLGSWCLSPMEPGRVAFHAHFPNLVYRPGVLTNLLISTAMRARFVEQQLATLLARSPF
jgi:hypothetical protein